MIKEKNPSLSVGEIAKQLGRKWQDTDSKKRKPFEEMAARDRQRYEDEKNNYNPPGDDEEEEDEDDYED